MSTPLMSEALPKPQNQEEIDRKRRKELKEAFKKKGGRTTAPRLDVVASKSAEDIEKGEREALSQMILESPTTEMAKSLFDELGVGVLSKDDFLALMRRRQKERQDVVSAATSEAPQATKVEEAPETAAPVAAETPIIVEERESSPTPEPAPIPSLTPASKFDTYDDLEEAFGRGEIELGEFLREKKRFLQGAPSPTETTAPAEKPAETPEQQSGGGEFYNLLKEYVAGKERQRQAQIEEEQLQARKRLRPKSRPTRGAEEVERPYKLPPAEFPPTEKMQQITQEMKSVVDKARAKWERLVAYKRLNAKTLQMIEGLEEDFRQLELLRNKFRIEETRERNRREVEKAKSKEIIRGPATRPVEQTPGFNRPTTIGEIQTFKEQQRQEEERRKWKQEEEKQRKRAATVLTAFMEKTEEAFGLGRIELDEFSAKRDLVKRLRTSPNIPEELDTAFGIGTLDLQEYKDLKSKLIKNTPQH